MVPWRFRGLDTVPLPGGRALVARTLRSRLLGLALLDEVPGDLGLLIPRCGAVHTFGMRFAIDIAFLDARGRVIDTLFAVPPQRFVGRRGARAVLERPAAQVEPTSPASR